MAHVEKHVGRYRARYRDPLGREKSRTFNRKVDAERFLKEMEVDTALEAGVPLRDVQIAARHTDPRTTVGYDHRRANFDKHAAYVVVAFVAGG